MDFQSLQSLQSKNSRLVNQRHDRSDEMYQKGMNDLNQAIASKFKDKKKLQSAIGSFMQAIRTQRNNPEPYIALGYLFMLLKDFLSAKIYFDSALEVAPDHSDAIIFLQYIRDNIHEVTQEESSLNEDLEGEINFDELYDTTEALIYTQLRLLMAEVSFQVVYVREKLVILEKRQKQVQSVYEQISQRIKKVSQEYDTSELLVKLKPLESLVKNVEKSFTISQKMVQVTSNIQMTIDQVFKAFDEDIELEPILDKCDFYADQLDELDGAGYNIKPVEKKYIQLVELIEKLQDKLDL